MLESSIERAFIAAVERRWPAALVIKLGGVGRRGLPDRMVLLPGGRVAFVELKKRGGKPRPLQEYTHNTLRVLGFAAEVFDEVEEALRWLETVCA